MSNDWKSELERIYQTPGENGAFSSVNKLFSSLKANGYNVSKVKIKEWLDNHYTYTIHKIRKLNFPRNPVFASHIDQNWQADILFLPELYHCVLVCIDVISRYAWGKAMRTKTGQETAKTFESIIEDSQRKPERLQTDKGSEFYNKHFKEICRKYKIKLYSTESDKKAAIAERCIKEIKKIIYRYLTHNHTNEYVKLLPRFFETYNKTFHSSIKMAPVDVSEINTQHVLRNLYGHLWSKDMVPKNTPKAKFRNRETFSVGDKVRVALDNEPFRKGYKGYWTTEVFEIIEVKKFFPYVKYKLINTKGEKLRGLFYTEQLQLTTPESARFTEAKILKEKIVKGKKWVLVTWKNEDPSIKRWIPKNQLH